MFILDVVKVFVEFKRVFTHSFSFDCKFVPWFVCRKKEFCRRVARWDSSLLPRPFHVVSLVNLLGFVFLSRASWGPGGPPVRNFENSKYPS